MRQIVLDYIDKPDPKIWNLLTAEEQRYVHRVTKKSKKVEKKG